MTPSKWFAYYADFYVVPTLVGILVLRGDVGLLGCLIGFIVWTIAEYVIHRILFHRVPLFKPAHDLHHARPSGRTGVTSWHSMAIFGVLGLTVPADIFAGLALGYLAYITAHHAVHHWRIGPRHPLYGLKMRHALHHRGVEANFGVVTTLWDRIFGTYLPRR